MEEIDIQGDYLVTQGKVTVGVIEGLKYDGLLGNDIGPRVHWSKPKSVLVVTRAQKRQEAIEEIQAQDTMRNYLQNHCDDQSQITQTDNSLADILQPIEVSQEVKSLLQGNVQDLIDFQSTDETLKQVRKSLVDKTQVKDHDTCYFKQNGIIMRKCMPQTRFHKQVEDQIVLPKQYREHVIEMAHDRTGHLGIQKTKDRITQHFYWPGINHQISKHCRECEQCQILVKKPRLKNKC